MQLKYLGRMVGKGEPHAASSRSSWEGSLKPAPTHSRTSFHPKRTGANPEGQS